MRFLPLLALSSAAQARALGGSPEDAGAADRNAPAEAPAGLPEGAQLFRSDAELSDLMAGECRPPRRPAEAALGPRCCPQPPGWGPVPADDTPEGFESFAVLHRAAQGAVTPAGYTLVARDLSASVDGISLEGIELLQSYDPSACAAICDDNVFCSSFDLYFERDPLLDPSIPYGCPNPPSTTNIKCALWSCPSAARFATNCGEVRGWFQVVIQGSNIYNKIRTPPPPPPAVPRDRSKRAITCPALSAADLEGRADE